MSDLTICIQYVGQFVDKQAIVVIPKNVMYYGADLIEAQELADFHRIYL